MAASNGTLTVFGEQTGRTYSIDLYLPDAVGGLVLFALNGASASTSPSQVRFDENIKVVDLSVITGTTAVGAKFEVNGASFPGNTLRYANFLNTLSAGSRPPIGWRMRAGSYLSATQV